MPAGAQAALAGYRLQFLYALNRVLENRDFHICLEGNEDLDVCDTEGTLLEVVQVKALSSRLKLSSLTKPLNDDGSPKEGDFVIRVSQLLRAKPDIAITLVTFGAIGPELESALADSSGTARSSVKKKLIRHGLTAHEADTFIDRLKVVFADESSLQQGVIAKLTSLATGQDVPASFDLLMYWIYANSEKSSIITHDDLLRRLETVGKYVAQRAAHVSTWFTTIVPIETSVETFEDIDALKSEYENGYAARLEHIYADLDIPRPEKMAQIDDAFSTARIVLIRGASGQGKSTLMYRWMTSRPPLVRLEVGSVQDIRHAQQVALAIGEFADATDLQLWVCHDVRPGTTSWIELASVILTTPNVRLLVAVREDDFNRASSSLAMYVFGECVLDFDRNEAELLFDRLRLKSENQQSASFEDAWARFGGGPLLEFSHLITQNVLLPERLDQQIAGIRNLDTRRLLRWAALADMYGAKLRASKAASLLGIADAGSAFSLLEKEHLLRTDTNDHIFGLHPVRSTILASILDRRDGLFESSTDVLYRVAEAVSEDDREIFLLHVLSRGGDESILAVLEKMNFDTWQGAIGVIRPLIWYGLHRYVSENRTVIDNAFDRVGSSWWVLIPIDTLNISQFNGLQTSKAISSIFANIDEDLHRFSQQLLSEMSEPEQTVPRFVGKWLSTCQLPQQELNSQNSATFAEVVFWAAFFGAPLADFRPLIESALCIKNLLSTETLSRIALAAHTAGVSGEVVSGLQAEIGQRLASEYNVVSLEIDEDTCRAVSLIRLDGVFDADMSPFGATRLHHEAVSVCRIMRETWPDRLMFSHRKSGHSFLHNEHDPSIKNIPRASLVPMWLSSFTGMFDALGTYPHRVATWPDWTKETLNARRSILNVLRHVISGLTTYLQRGYRSSNVFSAGFFDEKLLVDGIRLAKNSPLAMPKCSVDEWGFGGNSGANRIADSLRARLFVSGKPLHDATRSIQSYFTPLGAFLDFCRSALIVVPIVSRKETSAERKRVVTLAGTEVGYKPNTVNLSLENLKQTIDGLPAMQRAFRDSFGEIIDLDGTIRLDSDELGVLSDLWSLWTFVAGMMTSPPRTSPIDLRTIRDGYKAQLQAILKELHKKAKKRPWLVDVRSLNRHLWITVNSQDTKSVPRLVDEALVLVHAALPKKMSESLRAWNVLGSWDSIRVVTAVRGKWIARSCRSYETNLVVSGCTKFSNEVPLADLPAASGIEPLTEVEEQALEFTRHVSKGLAALSVFLRHYAEVELIPDTPDEYLDDMHDKIRRMTAEIEGLLLAVSGPLDLEALPLLDYGEVINTQDPDRIAQYAEEFETVVTDYWIQGA